MYPEPPATFQDVLDRLDELENRPLTVADLPLKALQDKLEINWLPDVAPAKTALLPTPADRPLTGAFADAFPITQGQIIMLAAFNSGGGGTYVGGFVYYDATNGLMTATVSNNITFQYAAGKVQWKSGNGVTYTLKTVLVPLAS